MVNWENKVTLVLCLQSLISNAQFQFPSVYLSSFFEKPTPPSPKGLCLSLAVIILFTQSEDHLEKYLPKVDNKSDMEVFLKNKNPSIHLAKFSLVFWAKAIYSRIFHFIFFEKLKPGVIRKFPPKKTTGPIHHYQLLNTRSFNRKRCKL
jgi:hypothetical protein